VEVNIKPGNRSGVVLTNMTTATRKARGQGKKEKPEAPTTEGTVRSAEERMKPCP